MAFFTLLLNYAYLFIKPPLVGDNHLLQGPPSHLQALLAAPLTILTHFSHLSTLFFSYMLA